jgi:hypothetical protein
MNDPLIFSLDDHRIQIEFSECPLGGQYNHLHGLGFFNWQRVDGNTVQIIVDNSPKA